MPFDVVVPALNIPTIDGSIDFTATHRYATHAAKTWVDFFILSGSTTRGDTLRPKDRAAVVDLWLDVVEPSRLLACCWDQNDIDIAVNRGVTPMAVLRSPDREGALHLLRQLPEQATIYSHPMFGGTVFDSDLALQAQVEGVLPTGGKLAKVTLSETQKICTATNGQFRLWDGSSRHIADSLAAGADGVVATPLSTFGKQCPEKDTAPVQAAINSVQAILDSLPNRDARGDYLIHIATQNSRTR